MLSFAPRPVAVWSYGKWFGKVQQWRRGGTEIQPDNDDCIWAGFRCLGVALVALLLTVLPVAAQSAAPKDRPVKIVALGDSLTAGYGLSASDAFPPKLQRALKAKGIDVEIVNAGVSGDTATGGLERLDWAVAPGTDAVIVELGANDMLRGLDHKTTRAALDTIVRRLRDK